MSPIITVFKYLEKSYFGASATYFYNWQRLGNDQEAREGLGILGQIEQQRSAAFSWLPVNG